MTTYFIGGSIGTLLAGIFWHWFGWQGVVGTGITLATLSLIHIFQPGRGYIPLPFIGSTYIYSINHPFIGELIFALRFTDCSILHNIRIAVSYTHLVIMSARKP